MSERFFPIATRDRMVKGQAVIGIFGPLAVPDRGRVVEALIRLASYGPTTRVALGFAPGGGWTSYDGSIAAWCDEMVIETDPASRETVRQVAESFRSLLDHEHPLRFVLAGDYVIQLNDHAIGDGILFIDRVSTVLAWASGDDCVPAWITAKAAPSPVRSALGSTFRTAASRRALVKNRADARSISRQQSQPADETMVPWEPQQCVVSVVVPRSSVRVIQSMTKTSLPRPSTSGVVISMLRKAMASEGIAVHPETTTLFNLRRYLPEETPAVAGNFVTGLPLTIRDPDDALQISEGMKGQIESARPLAAHAIGVIRSFLDRRESREVTMAPSAPRVRLVFTSMGVVRQFDRLPWASETTPDERTCSFMVLPGGPEHVTITVVVVGGAMYLDASFHSTVFDAAVMKRALERMAADPASLASVAVLSA